MLEILNDEDFNKLYELMGDSFPLSEIRTFEGQKQLLSNPLYTVYVLREEGEVLAFFAEWQNESYRFLEHLAVNRNYRSRGLGSKTLQAYHDLNDKPVVLEVEPPNDEIQIRRVKFYEKNGYHLSSYSYIQPMINAGYEGTTLALMTYPTLLNGDELNNVKKWLDQTVYNL